MPKGVFIWVWSTFSTTGADNAISALFIIRFTNNASGSSDPNSSDFLHFLILRTTGFFLIMVGEIEQLLKL